VYTLKINVPPEVSPSAYLQSQALVPTDPASTLRTSQTLWTSQTPQPAPTPAEDSHVMPQALLGAIRQLNQALNLNFQDIWADLTAIRGNIGDIRNRLDNDTPAHIQGPNKSSFQTWNPSAMGMPLDFVSDEPQDATSSNLTQPGGVSGYAFSNQQHLFFGSAASGGEADFAVASNHSTSSLAGAFIQGSSSGGTAAEMREVWEEYNPDDMA
jgi:hypothetical protein